MFASLDCTSKGECKTEQQRFDWKREWAVVVHASPYTTSAVNEIAPTSSHHFDIADMGKTCQQSRLLALPQELRTKIYEELLCPEPTKVYSLWHDREGRQGLFSLRPSILRVSKQIYYEAVSLLYDNNIFEINLTTNVVQTSWNNYLDGKSDPPPLFQKNGISTDPWTDETPITDSHLFLRTLEGVMNAQSFQRLRHIKIKTRRAAIWGWTTRESAGERFFSHTGELIMRVLKLLSEQPHVATPVQHTFEFQIVPDWTTKHGVFGGGRRDVDDVTNVMEMLILLRKIKKRRSVMVEEKVKPDDEGGFRPLIRVEVDVEA